MRRDDSLKTAGQDVERALGAALLALDQDGLAEQDRLAEDLQPLLTQG